MIKIIYSKDGKAYSDFQARNVILKALHRQEDIHTSSSCIVEILSYLIGLGYFSLEDIQVVNCYGKIRIHEKNCSPNLVSVDNVNSDVLSDIMDIEFLEDIDLKEFLLPKDYFEKPKYQKPKKKKMILRYDPDGAVYSDFEVRDVLLKHYYQNKDLVVSNTLFVTMTDWFHRTKMINATEIELASNTCKIRNEVTKYGKNPYSLSFFVHDFLNRYLDDCWKVDMHKVKDSESLLNDLVKGKIPVTRDILKFYKSINN